ncbi:MAG TPA: hypothetical protein VOB72_04745 [Candidatus Dormibacteraeota bacterium]|nr:hypothetical protein [Candidatus Dormibacteraeota bacterium]
MADENPRRAMLDADALQRGHDLRDQVTTAPLLRRAPGLRGAILNALSEREGLRKVVREQQAERERIVAEAHRNVKQVASERDDWRQRAERVEAALRRWHRPIASSGRPCVCAGCEDIAALVSGPDEVVFGQEIDLSQVAFEGFRSEPTDEGRDG